MPRTTLDIDGPVLAEIKELQRKEGKSLSKLVSELLTVAIAQRKEARASSQGSSLGFQWISHPMEALVDLSDKEALAAALERGDP